MMILMHTLLKSTGLELPLSNVHVHWDPLGSLLNQLDSVVLGPEILHF